MNHDTNVSTGDDQLDVTAMIRDLYDYIGDEEIDGIGSPTANQGSSDSASQCNDDPDNRDISNNVALHETPVRCEGSGQEPANFKLYDSPHGGRYWIPIVPDNFKPQTGLLFDSWQDAEAFYESYAEKAGFSVKKGQSKKNQKTGEVNLRYFMCSRGAKPPITDDEPDETSPSRLTSFKRTDCKAIMRTRVLKGTSKWEVFRVKEKHNHGLLSKDNLDFLAKRRKLTYNDQEFINNCRLAKIGASKAHKLQVALKGGHHNVRGTKTDYKNWARDNKAFVGKRDAQMFVDKMLARSCNLDNYTFKYMARDKKLICAFWADDVSKRNYKVFGDVIAFDATYDTNLYKMVFVPFTGVDHHKKCVTFGAALLANETIENYTWLLQQFLEAHDGNQPMLTLTDQDLSMKDAVEKVFDKTIHRLCTWHITQKLPIKVCGDVENNSDLKREFHKLVWNVYLKPETFEARWKLLIEKYNLENSRWLSQIYDIREDWVPAYFRHLPMYCLMKTTSRCESNNHAFKVISKNTNTLVEFILCFDTIIDAQRYEQRGLEVRTSASAPKLKCEQVLLEKHDASIYTRDVFKIVQNEIYRSERNCYIGERKTEDGVLKLEVGHQDRRYNHINKFNVTLKLSDNDVSCSCMGFVRNGYLCRHVFCAFRHHQIHAIPEQYITKRWRRDVLPSCVFAIAQRYEIDNSRTGMLRRRVIDNIQQCVDRVRSDEEKMVLLDQEIQKIKDQLFKENPNEPSSNKKSDVIQVLNCINDPLDIEIEPAPGIRNKGCGTAKRLRGPGEKIVEQLNRSLRKCGYCKVKNNNHDSRNCPKKKADEENLGISNEVGRKDRKKGKEKVVYYMSEDSTEDSEGAIDENTDDNSDS